MAGAWEAGKRNPREYRTVEVRGKEYEVRSALTVKANRLWVAFQRFEEMYLKAKAEEDKYEADMAEYAEKVEAGEKAKRPKALPKNRRTSASLDADWLEAAEEIIVYAFGQDTYESWVEGADGEPELSYVHIFQLVVHIVGLWADKEDEAQALLDEAEEPDPKE